MKKIKARIKDYFQDKENILVFSLLLALLLAGLFLRIRNLAYLAFWGDDGATYISTEAILKYGYPLLPSGNVMFHNILTYYVNAFFAIIFGLNEFSFRFTSVVCGLVTIVLTYFLGKVLVNKYVGLFSAFVVTFLNWAIEFSRQARYYAQFQVFFVASIFFFYLGYFKGIKKFKVLSIFFLAILGLVHDVGVLQIFIFLPLLIYKGREFFKKDVVIGFFVVLITNIVQIANQVFFWKVGRSFYPQSQDFMSIIAAYVKMPQWKYIRILDAMFDDMRWVAFWGAIVFILAGVVLDKKDELFGKFNYVGVSRFKIYENGFYLYFVLFQNLLFLEMGEMVDQPRYFYYLLPVFIITYVFVLFVSSYLIYKFIKFTSVRLLEIRGKTASENSEDLKNSEDLGDLKISEDLKSSERKLVKFFPRMPFVVLLTGVFMIFTVSGINIAEAINIPKREYGQKINPHYSFSTTRDFHSDSKTPGLYVAEHMEEDDIVITMDIYNSYPYTKKIDYWLWTGTLSYWQPYHQREDGLLYDDTLGAVVIRDFWQFIDVLNVNKDKNVWVLTTPSIDIKVHIHPSISKFLKQNTKNLAYIGKDGISGVYLFGKERKNYGIADFISPDSSNTIDLSRIDSLVVDFTSQDIIRYLIYGWSVPEEGGTWAMSSKSFLYLNLSSDCTYKMTILAKPLYDPTQPLIVDLFLNEEKIDTLTYSVDSYVKKEVIIKSGVLNDVDDISELMFNYSYNKRPIEVGIMNNDPRYLSLMVKSIEFSRVE